MNYRIIETNSNEEMWKAVENWIGKGWEPQGGVFVMYMGETQRNNPDYKAGSGIKYLYTYHYRYYQAIIRR